MTQIVEYSVTDAELANLAEKYAHIPDAKTEKGYQAIKDCIREIKPLRTSVEKRRKELKKDALEYGRKVDAEAKRITKALVDIETPFRQAKQAVDEEAARIEEEKRIAEEQRIERLTNKVKGIPYLAEGLLNVNSDEIRDRLKAANGIVCDAENFDEFVEQAQKAKDSVIESLNTSLESKIEAEKQQAEQARIAKEQAERQAELDRKEKEQRQREEESRKKMEAEQAEIRRKQEEIARKEREEVEKKLAAERAEAAKVKEEKERLEREAREAEKARVQAEAEEAERQRIEAAKPDRDKLRAFAESLLKIDYPDVDDIECNEILADALDRIHNTGDYIINILEETQAA